MVCDLNDLFCFDISTGDFRIGHFIDSVVQ